MLGTVILSLPAVQTRLARMATERINRDFGTDIRIDRLGISLISWNTALRDIFIRDYQGDTLAHIEKLNTSVLSLRDLLQGNLEFGDIDIERLYLNLKTYPDAPDTNLGIFIDKLDDGQPRPPGTPPFYFYASSIRIENSRFSLRDENLEKPQILDFSDLNIEADAFTILGPEVRASIRELALKSPRDLQIDTLATEFTYTREQMRFDSLRIRTPGSDLKGGLVFDYQREDLVQFTDKVQLTAYFDASEVSLDEVNRLYDVFGSGRSATFSTRVSGTLNALKLEDLLLVTDQTGIRGTFDFQNLFRKDGAFQLDAQIRDITTTYYQMRGLMPNLLGETLPSSLEKLGQFTVRGASRITENSVNAQVNINSRIGNCYADLDMTGIDQVDAAAYRGFISLIDFDLGDFAGNPAFGRTSLDFNVEGEGFTRETLNTEVIGEVYALTFNDYTYSDISVSGVLKDQLFDGSLNSRDPNLVFTFKGLADFGNQPNTFNFVASVDRADLSALNIIKDSVSVFRGNIDMDITGNDPDNIRGNMRFSQTQFRNAANTYYFEDFQVASRMDEDSVRTIEINSPDIITGYMQGKFRVRELGKLVQNSIGSIYTNYKPYEISQGQQLSFNFRIYNKIVEAFYPQVSLGPNTFMRGDIVADQGDFKLTFKSPDITAFGNHLGEVDVRIDNKNPLFNTYVSVADVETVYYDLKDFELINTTLNDTLFFRTEFKGGSQYNDTYNLNFYHTFAEGNKSVIGLKRSDVSFKGNTWMLNRSGNDRNKVIVNRTLDSIRIEEIVMNNEAREEIVLSGELADSTYKDLELRFKIVSLDKITPAIDSLKLSGEVNGVLNVRQEDDIYLPIGNLTISDFGINGAQLGQLDFGIVGNKDLSEFSVNTQITEGGREKFSVIGTVLNQGEIPEANLTASFSDFALEPFNPLGEGVIDQIRGGIDGTARIRGDIRNPDISGLLTLNDAGLAIPYLNVNYAFAPNSVVRLQQQIFDFQNIRLTDTAEGTHALLDGTITHQFFDDWRLNLKVDTQGDRFLILNTGYEEEALYYGQAFAAGEGRIHGRTTALNIDFVGATARGTSLKIPISDVASVGDYSFINFVEKGSRQTVEASRQLKEYQGLELNFDLDVTPEAEVEIVVDQQTGSSLKGTGAGLIFIEINTNGKFNMLGDFVVVNGVYNFKSGGVIDRTFRVKPGGTINWDGDPLAASLNMEAVYTLNANPAPLLENNRFSQSIPTEVLVRLTGELEQPTVDFDIEFPGTSSIVKSELEYRLQDPTVEERNAIFLLAQGTFVADGSGLNQSAVAGSLIGSATTNLFNQVLGGGDENFNLGVSYEAGYNDPNAEVNTEDRIGVTVSTRISDRILFNGRFGVPVGGVSESAVAGDAEVQLLLNKEGTLSMRIFNRQNEIQSFLAERQGYTQGVGLSYEVDFNSFRDLLQQVLKKRAKAPAQPPGNPADSLSGRPRPEAVMGKDSLIRFYSKNQKPF
ncbi:translocation/assembly module TamB [Robiginitalea sp. M366]|uniref:translocation/assembly module TamB domain-containing protein n=1 Tax=Robiginitalea aestuariiviva TaxID=3036903 RepID=UPI00240CED87|nr:translocation/assembly module TamB domain-containing protein [Robiginitalea aestuariiviva]MDG1572697.1 translocation/assembly module TamB [Robiginitalea aestuariiviva]